MVATSSDDTNEKQTIKLWDQRTGQLLAGWAAHTATVASVAFSRDGKILASGSLDSGARGHANLILWDVASRRMIAKLTGHTGAVRCLAFSPDGQTLASASDDLTVRIWDVASKRTRHVLSAHTSVVKSVAFSPDGRLLGSGSCDSTVRLWDVAAGRLTATLADHSNVFSVAFSATGSFLASVNEAGEIKVWDPARAQIIRTIHVNSEPLLCVRFTPDEHSVVAAGKGQTIHFWDTLTGQELLTLKGHQSQINALDFSADGSLLASCDHQGKVKIWRAEWPGLALAP
jgi:WD40 repeat protein